MCTLADIVVIVESRSRNSFFNVSISLVNLLIVESYKNTQWFLFFISTEYSQNYYGKIVRYWYGNNDIKTIWSISLKNNKFTVNFIYFLHVLLYKIQFCKYE